MQTGGLKITEVTGKLDCQLVIEMIGRTWDRQFAQYASQPRGPYRGRWIYIERERERERTIYVYIYIYIYTPAPFRGPSGCEEYVAN